MSWVAQGYVAGFNANLESSSPVGGGHSATSHPTILASQVAWITELSHKFRLLPVGHKGQVDLGLSGGLDLDLVVPELAAGAILQADKLFV